ncbi:hypothetical protein OS493_039891, partial [Desmophyllum pertusum]
MGFNDFVITLPLPERKRPNQLKEGKTEVGQFKGAFRIFSTTLIAMTTPWQHGHLRPKKPIDCVCASPMLIR